MGSFGATNDSYFHFLGTTSFEFWLLPSSPSETVTEDVKNSIYLLHSADFAKLKPISLPKYENFIGNFMK